VAVAVRRYTAICIRRPHRFRVGTVALREIRKYQKSAELLISKAPFNRVVREIAQDFSHDVRFNSFAYTALQEVTEPVDTSQNAKEAATHAHRVSIMLRGMLLAPFRPWPPADL
jgi:histone H3